MVTHFKYQVTKQNQQIAVLGLIARDVTEYKREQEEEEAKEPGEPSLQAVKFPLG